MKKGIIFTIGIILILIGLIITNPIKNFNMSTLGWIFKVIGVILIIVSLFFKKMKGK